jgi:hypothetical protein
MGNFVTINLVNATTSNFTFGTENDGFTFSNPPLVEASQTPTSPLYANTNQSLTIGPSGGSITTDLIGSSPFITSIIYTCDALKLRFGIQANYLASTNILPLVSVAPHITWQYLIDSNVGQTPDWIQPANPTGYFQTTVQGADGNSYTFSLSPSIGEVDNTDGLSIDVTIENAG